MKFDIYKVPLSQSSYFKSRLDPVTLGELGGLKFWKTLRLEGLGRNLVGKISRSPIYMIDIIRTDPLYLEELGGG